MGKIYKDELIFFLTIAQYESNPVIIHALFNERANAENRIKELMYDYGIEGFAIQDFAAMVAAFPYVMIAINVMAVFKQIPMKFAKRKMRSTFRFQCIAIAS